MGILIFLGIPVAAFVLVMLLTLPRALETDEDRKQKFARSQAEEPPRFTRDYTGRIWVEKRRKGFFRPIPRRSKTPPGEQEE